MTQNRKERRRSYFIHRLEFSCSNVLKDKGAGAGVGEGQLLGGISKNRIQVRIVWDKEKTGIKDESLNPEYISF